MSKLIVTPENRLFHNEANFNSTIINQARNGAFEKAKVTKFDLEIFLKGFQWTKYMPMYVLCKQQRHVSACTST